MCTVLCIFIFNPFYLFLLKQISIYKLTSNRVKNAIFGVLLFNWINVIMYNVRHSFYGQHNFITSEIFNSSNAIILILSSIIFGVYIFYLGIIKISKRLQFKFKKTHILPIIVLSSLFSPVVYAYVFQQESHSVEMMILNEIFLEEDFEDVTPGTDPPGWEEQDGDWAAYNDSGNIVYYQGDNSDRETLSMSLSGNSSWVDYLIKVDLKFVEGSNRDSRAAVIVFRYQGGNSYYQLVLREYYDTIALFRHGTLGGGNMVSSLSHELLTDVWYHVELLIVGDIVNVSVDYTPFFVDTAMSGSYDYGSVGIGTMYYGVMFDNVSVEPI